MEKRQLVPFLEGDLACQFVGARDPDSDGHFGPVAEITHGDDWLHIVTDPSEGNVMLNIEALPKLIEALERIRDASRALTSPTAERGAT